MEEKLIWGMRLARMLSACIEVCAAVLLLRMADPRAMLRLNSLLGLVGPVIFITVSALGLAASLGRLQPGRVLIVLLGVALVVWGTR
ncbi:hypothetical protein J2Z79_001329 [Symbiobacterium terraclitae]|uniref:DUF2619 domain-containing protein n=1 Tax=Symbiobacterium terraclitae TaxID=557451 RepID=A0ABS4JQY7_9FIRM|nr:hypothetical protein [Symbiobacterium terraclitae]